MHVYPRCKPLWWAGLCCLLTACSSTEKEPALTAQEAIALAVRLANQEAKRLYDVAPFHAHPTEIVFVTNGWAWQSLAGVGKVDLVGEVKFERNGANPQVRVEMFASGLEPRPSLFFREDEPLQRAPRPLRFPAEELPPK